MDERTFATLHCTLPSAIVNGNHQKQAMTKAYTIMKNYNLSSRPLYLKELVRLKSTKVEGTGSEPVAMDSAPRVGLNTHCVVDGAHAFILRVSSFFGLAPLKFESRSDGLTVSISGAMCIYSYILVTILVISAVFGIVDEISVGVELSVRMPSRTSQVVRTCDVLMVVATAGAGVYGAPHRMRNMLKFMESVAAVDNSIGGKYSKATERKLCAVLLSILIFLTVTLTNDFCFFVLQAKANRQWDAVTNYIGFYLLWYVVMVLELQFAFTVLSVLARFEAVNEALALTARQVSIPILGGSWLAMSPCESVRRLAALHGTLCEVVRCVDSSYGLPLIVVLISTLFHMIITPYFLIIETSVSTDQVHFIVLYFLWCLIHMLRMMVLVEPCHYTISEGRRTERLVGHLMNSAPLTGSLPFRIKLFSRQLMLQSVSYSPLGMCTLHRPLVVSVIGAVTTYLVILIQFQSLR